MDIVRKRVVIHFPGFEPLDAADHHERYRRTAAESARLWNCRFEPGPLEGDDAAPHFDVRGTGPNWQTDTRIHILDHNRLIALLRRESLAAQLLNGYVCFARIALAGGLWRYFRHAWRFGLFFLFAFVVVAIALAAALLIAAVPVIWGIARHHLVWSALLALAFFRYVFLPLSARYHLLHLFADWRFGVTMATLGDRSVDARIDECRKAVRDALAEPADEYLFTSHSMGTTLAVHAVGSLLEAEPDTFAGKRVVFATLGSVLLQSALLRPAAKLRARTELLLRNRHVKWFEVQTLTDPIHFHRVCVASALGHHDVPALPIVHYRLKNILTREHYCRVKSDFLRVHRQYVLALDKRGPFDIALFTAGPLPAACFAGFHQHNLPPIGEDGAALIEEAKAA
jgi:hypothetical protein